MASPLTTRLLSANQIRERARKLPPEFVEILTELAGQEVALQGLFQVAHGALLDYRSSLPKDISGETYQLLLPALPIVINALTEDSEAARITNIRATNFVYKHYPLSALRICHSLTAVQFVSHTEGSGQQKVRILRRDAMRSRARDAGIMGSALEAILKDSVSAGLPEVDLPMLYEEVIANAVHLKAHTNPVRPQDVLDALHGGIASYVKKRHDIGNPNLAREYKVLPALIPALVRIVTKDPVAIDFVTTMEWNTQRILGFDNPTVLNLFNDVAASLPSIGVLSLDS